MNISNMNAQNAAFDSTKCKFPWKWELSDLQMVEKNKKTVFSCFSCGGGSTMGYKLAGYTVLGNCEIDPDMMRIYKANHHPKYSYLMDIREFNKIAEIPHELKNLDILDGSPPCSTFSTIGDREKSWGKNKKFREGQKEQILDDLFFYYLDTVKKLQPKVFIAENVKGIVQGNAKGYVNAIIKKVKEIGYDVQIFLLNSANMGVPQNRERVFFIGNRMHYKPLKLRFKIPSIRFGIVRGEVGVEVRGKDSDFLKRRLPTDKYVSWIECREKGKKRINFRHIVSDSDICSTIVSNGAIYRGYDGKAFSDYDFARVQTFPTDYDFMGESAQYVCGMSVPPVMMANIADEIYLQWFGGEKSGET